MNNRSWRKSHPEGNLPWAGETEDPSEMDYDVVIATRNRARALEMSLPLIAAQTVKPSQIIIVDASDDGEATQTAVASAVGQSGIKVQFISSQHRNSSLQRNVGLDVVTAPIVMMPDDDSLWYPSTAEETLKIYESDRDGLVGGVTGIQTLVSPLRATEESYKRDRTYLLKQRLQPLRGKLEDRIFPQPFRTFARELWATRHIPAWIDGTRSALVETIAGFRMSFRSDIIRAAKFDGLLGYNTGYAQHEDMELSLRLQKEGKLLVSAEAALVFHHVFPSKRADGFKYGFGQIANYIYACVKIMQKNSLPWSQLERYTWYKVQLYRLKRDDYGRSVFAGAQTAWTHRHVLMDVRTEDLTGAYRRLCDRYRSGVTETSAQN